ncbi:glypican-6 [Carassius gibelio]|uniref:glypican-6 n=1 Tax=Carassius gibelio TaxID=101364 RepID=UPI0022789A6C|nr:glypican-6 [Carassius gibelio]
MKKMLVVFTVCLSLVVLASAQADQKAKSCNDVRTAYSSKGFNVNDVPNKGVHGNHLKVCPQGFSCCTLEMEEKLSQQSHMDLKAPVHQLSSNLRKTFTQRHRHFDQFFRELLSNAEKSFKDMFEQTYGMIYVKNADLFENFFSELRRFYNHGSSAVNLDDMLTDFWRELLERMFRLVNVHYEFSDSYMECVSRHMEQLKPFGDIPRKMHLQLTRSFIAARAFSHGLALIPDIVGKVSTVGSSPSCVRAAMKMLYCPYCTGQVALKPCKNYCLNVMRGCLANQADLDTEWNNFLDAMLGLAERLQGPFDFEASMGPIAVAISHAIMNMQENSGDFSTKVFHGCGRPKFSTEQRTRRSPKDSGFPGRFRPYISDGRPTTGFDITLFRMLTDAKKKLNHTKKFWSTLPDTVCVGERIAIGDECWNGTAKSRYESVVIGNGLANQVSNPDVEVDITKPDMVIRRQIPVLKEMTSRLKAAYTGTDISFVNEDAGSGEESGSGCDSPPCDSDIYFSTPAPIEPRIFNVQPNRKPSSGGTRLAPFSLALAVTALLLALLTPHMR